MRFVMTGCLLCALAPGAAGAMTARARSREAKERAAVVTVLDGIFAAYVRGDRNAIARRHTFDWVGFGRTGRRVTRGLEEYMVGATYALTGPYRPVRYEILDREVVLRGDVAVVPYTARYVLSQGGTEIRIVFRSLDVFRREADGWQQWSSNLCTMLDEPARYPALEDFAKTPPLRLGAEPEGQVAAPPSEKARLAWSDQAAGDADREAAVRIVGAHIAAAIGGETRQLAEISDARWVGFSTLGTTVARRVEDVRAVPWTIRDDGRAGDFEVLVRGDLALVFSMLQAQSAETTPIILRSLHVVTREAGAWRVLSHQTCPFPMN